MLYFIFQCISYERPKQPNIQNRITIQDAVSMLVELSLMWAFHTIDHLQTAYRCKKSLEARSNNAMDH